MKTKWPAILGVLWMVLFGVPQTRAFIGSAWSNRYAFRLDHSRVEAPPYAEVSPLAATLLRRFPGDKQVEIFAADSRMTSNGGNSDTARLAKRYPRDASVLAMFLRDDLGTLRANRQDGPFSNFNFPAPPTKRRILPRWRWERFIAGARTGQVLESNNTFFDWMLLYGLYATRQDAAARAVLHRAARKTRYDDHVRETSLNRIEMLHRAYGAAVSPIDSVFAWNDILFPENDRIRRCSEWIMDGVVRDRRNRQHARALDAAFDLLRLGRVMRRNCYTLTASFTARRCESDAIYQVTWPKPAPLGAPPLGALPLGALPLGALPLGAPPLGAPRRLPRVGQSLTALQNHPRMLYRYAREQRRGDITSFLDTEWLELGEWKRAEWRDVTMTGESNATWMTRMMITLPWSERGLVLTLRALPAAVLLWGVFSVLAARFPAQETPKPIFGMGFWLSALLWLYLSMIDVQLTVAMSCNFNSGLNNIFEISGCLRDVPVLIPIGLSGLLFCWAWAHAIDWQKKQAGPPFDLNSWWKELFNSPRETGNSPDFGPLFQFVAYCSVFLAAFVSVMAFGHNILALREFFGRALPFISSFVVILALAGLFFYLAVRWWSLPFRRQAIYRGFQLVSQAMLGFLVATSLLFVFLLGLVCHQSVGPETDFEAALQKGELAVLRAHLGLTK